jgi:hypothetical protein
MSSILICYAQVTPCWLTQPKNPLSLMPCMDDHAHLPKLVHRVESALIGMSVRISP